MNTFYTFEIKYAEHNCFDFTTSVLANNLSEATTKANVKASMKAWGEFSITYKKSYLS
jgi:hypothetical protein